MDKTTMAPERFAAFFAGMRRMERSDSASWRRPAGTEVAALFIPF
ncbi:hypothetical protein [Methylocapsa palsarum]|nr:hypothetical protein [Methylocapsa palsarum]